MLCKKQILIVWESSFHKMKTQGKQATLRQGSKYEALT